MDLMQHTVVYRPCPSIHNSQNPVQSLKFGEDCKIVINTEKIVTLSKQLLYITRDVTCDHMI